MKCENCKQEGFDALLTLAGSGALHADGWCLDCIKKWSYAHKHIKLDKPKIEYQCNECNKQLYPQNGVTYVYQVKGMRYGDSWGEDCDFFTCREHGEGLLEKQQSGDSDYKDLTITRYTREMHLKALEEKEKENEVSENKK